MKVSTVLLTTFLCATVLSGCIFRPYKIPVEQGTTITTAMIQQIKPGMTEDQVQYILGTPNIQDPFHPNDWYYIYSIEQNYQPRSQKTLQLTFVNGQLNQIQGDYPPPQPLAGAPSTGFVTTS